MSAPSPESPIRVGFISLGCSKNLVDSQLMAGTLITEGVMLAGSPDDADVIVVNTCAFIDAAREEAVESILSACRQKETGPCRAVVVTGCLSQRYRDELVEELPEVDAFVGLDELEDIAAVVKRVVGGEHDIVQVSDRATRLYDARMPALVFTGGPYAYLKIAEGCNHACAFCAIPGIRGAYRSRSVTAIKAEAEALLESGIRELNLISQDVTAYGCDSDESLPDLLRALGSIGGEFWIRLLYGYPGHISDALLEAMASIPQVLPYVDLPIQHSHPDMLRAMQRAETVRAVAELGTRLRSTLPDVVLRTTCLLGFPGETDEHVAHLLDTLASVRFDHLGAFVFSPEEGTPAAALPDCPPREVAEARREQVMLAQRRIVDEKAAALVGTEAQLLLEKAPTDEHTCWIGRTGRQGPDVDGETLLETVSGARPGAFIRVRYTEQDEYDLWAEPV
jgi:ribosomal protein S12 methylthiotransferase